MKDLITNLARSPFYYDEWFESASDQDQDQLWQFVWDSAAKTHAGNTFVEGVYDFYQKTGYLSHSQFHYLCKTVFPSTVTVSGLKERLNERL